VEICAGLVIVILVVGLIAIVGHLIWITVAAVFSALAEPVDSGKPPVRPDREPLECVLCGSWVQAGRRCSQCGLDSRRDEAVQLAELETTRSQITKLAQTDELPQEAAATVMRAVAQRRAELLQRLAALTGFNQRPKPLTSEHSPRPVAAVHLEEVDDTPEPALDLALMEQLLAGGLDVRQLTSAQRHRALTLYRKRPPSAWARLSPAVLLALARLVAVAGLGSRALELYQILLVHHPEFTEAGVAAVEAAILADQLGAMDKLAILVQRAASLPLTSEQRSTVEQLQAKLGAAVPQEKSEEPIPFVHPAEQPLPAPAPVIFARRIDKPVPVAAAGSPQEVLEEDAITVAAPPAQRRSFGEMMAAFMEERNILWGELVGGLLIVGCSIALVISLREKLEEFRYFPFLMISAVTAALIGAGRYTLSHWKLESTSRGLLVIGALMVPLSFMVLADLASGGSGDALDLTTEAAAIVVFTWLVRGAANILVRRPMGPAAPGSDWLATLAILGASASMLLGPHIEQFEDNPGSSGLLGIVGYGPAAFFVLTQAFGWQAVYRRDEISARQAGGLFLGLALSVFALGVTFGFILIRTGHAGKALEYLAVPVALAGLPLLLGGTIATAKMRRDEKEVAGEPAGLPFGVAAVIATMLSLGGTLVLLLALGAAWPHPIRLTAIATVNAGVLAFVAHRFRLAPAYVPAQICLAVAALTGCYMLAGYPEVARTELAAQILASWLSPASAVVLVVLGGLLAGAAEWQARGGRAIDSRFLAVGAGVVVLVSLLLALGNGSDAPGRAALVFGVSAAGAWLANIRWRLVWLTTLAAAVLWGAALFALNWLDAELPWAQCLVWSLVADAGVVLLLAAFVERVSGPNDPQHAAGVNRVYVVPLHWAALTASVGAALFLIPALRWDWLDRAALATLALACFWLVLAWRQRQPALFAAFQTALALATAFGVVRALQTQTWFTDDLASLLADIRSWQAYGAGLSGLALAWVAARFGLRKNDRAWALVEPGWLAVDRLLLGGLVMLAVVVHVVGIAPGVEAELTTWSTMPVTLYLNGWLSWCWLGLLAVALASALWQGRAATAVPALTAVALCVPVVAAAVFAADVAVASAVRWGLASFFIAGSALLWWRGAIARWAAMAGMCWDAAPPIAAFVRGLLVTGAVVPVLLLTVDIASTGFAGLSPAGPLEGSFFARLGPIVNNTAPLVLLCAGLAGHGVRERSAGYAFFAGLVALTAVVGGHALGIVTRGEVIGNRETVQLGQLATLVSAVWLLDWLGVRRRLDRPAAGQTLSCGVMLGLQEGLTWASYLVWLLPAQMLLVFPGLFQTMGGNEAAVLKMEAGSWMGWLATGLAIAAGTAYRLDAVAAVPTWFVGLASLLIGGLLSCSVAIYAPEWDQRTLMLVAAALALVFVLTLVRWSIVRPGPWLIPSKDSSVELVLAGAVGALAVMLAVQRAATVDDHYWPALAVAIVAIAAVAAAFLRRGEIWMFVASLLAMLTMSLVFYYDNPFELSVAWVVSLVQANLITAALVGLFWLYYLCAISPEKADSFHYPWLCLHQGLVLFGNGYLLALSFGDVITGKLASDDALVLAVGRGTGWLALLPAIVGLVWLLYIVTPRHTLHGLAAGGLMVGVLAASTVTHWDHGAEWLGHHALTLSWLLVAASVLVAAWRADRHRQTASGASRPWWTDLIPRDASIAWVIIIGATVAVLAFASGWQDPYRPLWPSAVVLAVSVLMGALAVWTRRGGFEYASGLLVNVVGQLLWLDWLRTTDMLNWDERAYRFILIHILCLALASLVWSGIELGGRRWFSLPMLLDKTLVPFRHSAGWLAIGLLTLVAGSQWLTSHTGAVRPQDPFVWFAIAALVLAAAVTLWDGPEERWAGPLPQLYVLGLLTLSSLVYGEEIPNDWAIWVANVALGPYVLVTSLLCRLGLANPTLGEELGMPRRPRGWPLGWFLPVQAICSTWVVVFGVSACLVFDDFGRRLGVFGAVTCSTLAAIVLTPHWARLVRSARQTVLADDRFPRLTALLLGVLACAFLHCAFVSPKDVAPWLHRSVWLMAALTWMSALYGLLLPRLLPADNRWAQLARRLATPLGLSACGVLMLVLVQEFFLYNPAPDVRRTPMVPAGVVLVGVALAVLIGGALTFALSPAHDQLKLSERGRTFYVYGAEALVALLLFHLRLNVPDIYPLFFGQFWFFVIMAVAFLGVGLSELCERRGLRVLADPLQRTAMFLPLLPVLAFLVRPSGNVYLSAAVGYPGLDPWLRLINRLPDNYHFHATLWMLMGLLYLVVALSRRSSNLALVAVVLANFGLWVLFSHHGGLTFLVHPQLWLIPIGLIVLAAEHLNRQHLQPPTALALRYAGLLLIYLSSTADMFITGLGQSVLLPVVLTVLSVLGVLMGILLRVRAFLFLGVTFLFLVVFSQIWHAAVDQAHTWVWWVSGIVLGVAILTLFAFFEKRRNDVLKMIDELKRWR
jgi:hypothetical protein